MMFKKQKGQKASALAYVLMAVALMAMLTYAISRDGGGQQHKQMSASEIKLLATDLIKQATSATMAVKQMEAFGTNFDDLRFDLPGTAAYALNTSEQIYHPSGGGLGVFNATDKYLSSDIGRGWKWQNLNNVEWSVSTADDLIFSFIDIDYRLCEEINKQLHGSTNIPSSDLDFSKTLIHDIVPNDDFIIAECAACEGVKSMCISTIFDNGGIVNGLNGFYNIIGSR